MILRWKLCLVILVASSTLVVSGPAAAQEMDPPPDRDLETPPGIGEPKGEPKGGIPKGEPKGAVPKGERPDREPPDREPPDNDEKKLLEAGGDLSLPQQSATDTDKGDDSRFPLWRIAGMILSAGVFALAGYLVFSPRR